MTEITIKFENGKSANLADYPLTCEVILSAALPNFSARSTYGRGFKTEFWGKTSESSGRFIPSPLSLQDALNKVKSALESAAESAPVEVDFSGEIQFETSWAKLENHAEEIAANADHIRFAPRERKTQAGKSAPALRLPQI